MNDVHFCRLESCPHFIEEVERSKDGIPLLVRCMYESKNPEGTVRQPVCNYMGWIA